MNLVFLITGSLMAIVMLLISFLRRRGRKADSLSILIWISCFCFASGVPGMLFVGHSYSPVALILGFIFAIAAGVVFIFQLRQQKEHDYLFILIWLSGTFFIFGAFGALIDGHPYSFADLIAGFIFAIAAGVVFLSQSRHPKEHERMEEDT